MLTVLKRLWVLLLTQLTVLYQSESLEIEGRSLWQDARIRFMRNKAAMVSLFILTIMVLAVIFLPMLAQYTYDDTDWYAMHVGPNADHWFGTDSLGRDLYVRTLIGGRISLMVGVMGAFVAVLIGTLYEFETLALYPSTLIYIFLATQTSELPFASNACCKIRFT